MDDVLKVAGALALTAAGFIVSPVAGLVVAGLLLILAGWLSEG